MGGNIVSVIRSYVCENCGHTFETENFEAKECEVCKKPVKPEVVYDESEDQ